jgi:hypothetical protein
MFRGDSPSLHQVLRRALAVSRDAGHRRAGSEHLLIALTMQRGVLTDVLDAHGAATAAVHAMVRELPAGGAAASADGELLAGLGIDIHGLLEADADADVDAATVLDQPPLREPLFPLGARANRRRHMRATPAFGLDAQAAYEASLRLALARRERDHRPEHLALTLLSIDPGICWLLAAARVDQRALIAHLSRVFPPPQRNRLLSVERRLGRSTRQRTIVHWHQRTTGHIAGADDPLAGLITG